MRVLVLDDETLTRKHFCSEINSFDPTVETIECRSLEDVRRNAHQKFDLAFIDLRLGDAIAGIDAAKILKAAGTQNIVFVTAFSDPETIKAACEVEPRAYLTKPLNMSQLIATLNFVEGTLRNEKSAPAWDTKKLILAESCLAEAKQIIGANDVRQKTRMTELVASCLEELEKIRTRRLEELRANEFAVVIDRLTVCFYMLGKNPAGPLWDLKELLRSAIEKTRESAESNLNGREVG